MMEPVVSKRKGSGVERVAGGSGESTAGPLRSYYDSRVHSPFSLECAAILFDLDGVLVNSAVCVERTWQQWALRHHLDPAHVIEIAHGRRTIETIRLAAPHLPADEEATALEAGDSHTTEGIFEVPGARELLLRLPTNAWAIVTSGIRAVATLRIRLTQLSMPEILVCGDEITRGKPDPEGYLTAAKRLGISPADCVVVEDAPAGLGAARAGGMRSIGVSGTYAPSALAMADWTIPDLKTLRVTRADHGLPLRIHLASP
jgi:sugar-phosphatase